MPTINIYYPSHSKNIEMSALTRIIMAKIEVSDLNKYYECIYSYTSNIQVNDIDIYLEHIFELFNSDNNPLSAPKYQTIIKNLKAHTSMSVGDVIQVDDNYYVVDGLGFKELN